MTEATITCPNCQTLIPLTESLAAPLLAATRKQFEQQLQQKDQAIAQREQGLREQQEQLQIAQRNLQEQVSQKVSQQLAEERKKLIEEETRKAKQAAAAELEQKSRELNDLNEVLKQRYAKLAEAQKAQAELIKKQRELDDAKRELELTVEKRVQTSLNEVRTQARREAEEGLKLRVMEKDQTIAAMQQKIEELKQKAEQGSQQLQGEVQELELENLLRSRFLFDSIEPVAKGEFGGDVLQRVNGLAGNAAGSILWESKRTKNWSDGWLVKLREDQRNAKSELAVLVATLCLKASTALTSSTASGFVTRAPHYPSPPSSATPCWKLAWRASLPKASTAKPKWSTKIPHRPTLQTTCGSHRRSLLHHAGRPRQRTQSHYETVGETASAD